MPRLTSAASTFSAIGSANPANVTAFLYTTEAGYVYGQPIYSIDYPLTTTSAQFGFYTDIAGSSVVATSGATGTSKNSYLIYASNGYVYSALSNPNVDTFATDDYFGFTAAMDATYTIIGAVEEDNTSTYQSSGAAYIFYTSNGALYRTLTNPNAYANSDGDFFGSGVGVANGYAAVGAFGEDDAGGIISGKVYIFNISTGNLTYTLNNPNPANTSQQDQFGRTLGAWGNYLAVGAPWEEGNFPSGTQSINDGKVYLYTLSNGTQFNTLSNPYNNSGRFGSAIKVSDNLLMVGAPYSSDGGKAHLYNVTNGVKLYSFDNPNTYGTGSGDNFGYTVGVSSRWAVVGAQGEDAVGGSTVGVGYVYSVANGSLLATINNPNPYGTINNDQSSFNMSVSNSYIVASSRVEDPPSGTDNGVVNIYRVTDVFTPYWANASLLFTKTGTGATWSSSCDLEDGYMIIGDTGASVRKAYMYDLNSNTLVYTFNNPTSNATADSFASSVSISNNYCVIAAQGYPQGFGYGRIYVYKTTKGDWTDTTLLNTIENPNYSGTQASDLFGTSVAIDGTNIIATAQNEEDTQGGVNVGVAYIINAVSGSVMHTIVDPNAYDIRDNDQFGRTCDISGNYAIAGAIYEDSAAGNTVGAAYIMDVSTGNVVKTLTNPNNTADDVFGISVSIHGNYLVVGARGVSSRSGKAYVYTTSSGNWSDASLLYTLSNPNDYGTTGADQFGTSVAINSDIILVGADMEDSASYSTIGRAYMYSLATGNLIKTITSPVNAANQYFGGNVKLSRCRAMIGTESARAHIYEAAFA